MNRLRQSAIGLIVLVLCSVTGCSLCCSPYADDYVTFGSRTPRFDRKHGRVGSILSDQMMGSEYVEQTGDVIEYADESSEPVRMDDDAISLGSPSASR
jgi:hypothetical protein